MAQLHYGLHAQLEEAATELIRKSLEGVTSMAEKSDILTPWKEMDRRRREVYTPDGAPDAALRRGMYHRAWNPWYPELNSTEGRAPVESLNGGSAAVRVPYDEEQGVCVGLVYNLALKWGSQSRLKCPGCSHFFRDTESFECKCGAVLRRGRRPGYYQIVRLA